jgi:anaerobic magnesium-protoporphyrin IX monomethyl ester cyclase
VNPIIALVNHPGMKVMEGIQIQTPTPPIGLAYVAAALKERGLAYQVIDACGEALHQVTPFPLRPDCLLQGLRTDEIIARIHPDTDIVGLTCLFSHYWPIVRELARAVKVRFPRALIVLGGEHATALPEHVLRSGCIDVCVLGEGEETFVRLIDAYRGGGAFEHVPGIAFLVAGTYRHNGLSPRTRKVDDIPWPDWESFPIDQYVAAQQVSGIHLGRAIPILGTRGCPYQCTFCSSPGMWTTRWIPRDPRKLVDEMEYFQQRYGLNGFTFMDLTFVVQKEAVKKFARELIGRKLNVVYQLPAGTRCEGFDDEAAELLWRSGLRNFAFAPESGSAEVRDLIKKRVDIDRMFAAIRSCLRWPMTIGCYIVIGFPEDSVKSLRETLRLVRRLAIVGIHDVTISKFTPYPGSAQFAQLLERGRVRLDDRYFLSPMDFFTDKSSSYCDAISERQLYRWMLWMFVNFYVISFCLRPWRVAHSFFRYFTEGVEETKYMRWFADRFVLRRRWRHRLRTTASVASAAEKV